MLVQLRIEVIILMIALFVSYVILARDIEQSIREEKKDQED